MPRIQRTGTSISGTFPEFPPELDKLMSLLEQEADSLERVFPIWEAHVRGFKGKSKKRADTGPSWDGGIVRVERQTGYVLVAFPAWTSGKRCGVMPALYNYGVTKQEGIKVILEMIATLK